MGRFFLLFILIFAGYLNICSRQSADIASGPGFVGKNAAITTVYLVRHAEKETNNAEDPDLTAAGLKRAQDLKFYLKDTPLDAFFSTKYKRNQKTIAPLAQGRPVLVYEAHDFAALRDQILANYKGKSVLVVAHSNTLLPLVEAFGAQKPFAEIGENDYDNIFRIRIADNGKATLQAKKFGIINTQPARL
jgi:2,3-bisphosphoglycerate-dependent phosphoglycerate mutase